MDRHEQVVLLLIKSTLAFAFASVGFVLALQELFMQYGHNC